MTAPCWNITGWQSMQKRKPNLGLFDVFAAAELTQSLHRSTDHLQRQGEGLQPGNQVTWTQGGGNRWKSLDVLL